MLVPKTMEYVEVCVEVPSELVDAVCDFIIENITSGLILEEEENSSRVGIVFYVPENDRGTFRQVLTTYLSDLYEKRSESVPEIGERTVQDVDWIDKFKASVQSVAVGQDILVRPGWRQPAKPIKYDIIIEPKMAFGTGSHETTQSCLLAIRDYFKKGMRFLDLGTGSGVLSVLADKMGASYIKSLDCDVIAVENCRENFIVNSVTAPHNILFGSVENCEGDNPYDFICANIIKSTILPILPRLLTLTASKGYLVLSGLLEKDRDEIHDSLRNHGQDDFSVRQMNEWITYVVHKG